MRSPILPALALVVLVAVSPGAARADALELVLMAASAETLAEPHDIVLSPDGERLFVADNGNDRIVVLDAKTLSELGTFGEDELGGPHDVVFDVTGRLLVADTHNDRIAVFAVEGASGHLTGSIEGGIRAPEGVGIDATGRVYATGARSGNLVVFVDGRVVAEVGGFSAPHDVEFDPSGRAWVADASNDRLVRLDASLAVEHELSGSAYGFNGPRYMDFDAAGRLYVADKYSNQIKIVAPDGTLLKVLGTSRSGKGEGLFDRPEGVEIRGRDVWFSDTYNDRIVRYRLTTP